jgi:PucR family transcriptional regulator, purine catabolism regulatory protein
VADAQRRLQGDFFDELARGDLLASQAGRGLERFGFERAAPVVVVSVEPANEGVVAPEELAAVITDERSRAGGGFLASAHEAGVHLLLPAQPAIEAGSIVTPIAERMYAELRAGVGSAVDPVDVGRSLREARYALQVCRLEGWDHAGFEDLGTYRLLLSMTEPDALRAFADSLLTPLDGYDRDHQGELVSSLRTFLDHNARWEAAASALFIHRHTLRYRMRKVEELTGRDLSGSFDRMEFWLALRARDLQAAQAEG